VRKIQIAKSVGAPEVCSNTAKAAPSLAGEIAATLSFLHTTFVGERVSG